MCIGIIILCMLCIDTVLCSHVYSAALVYMYIV